MQKKKGNTNYESRFSGPRHTPAMHQNFFKKDLIGILMAQSDHGKAVTNEHDIDAGSVNGQGGREVVGGDHGDGLVLFVHGSQGSDGYFFLD